jgi:hypothetical protein
MHVTPSNRGSVLVLVAAIAGIVIVIGVGLLQIGFHSRIQAVRAASALSARCAADAGFAHARFQMNNKLVNEPVWNNSTLPSATDVALDGSEASFSYTVTGAPPSFQITATGTAGGTQRRVLARLDVGSAWGGIGVKDTIDVKRAAVFGTIPPEAAGDLTIRTNSVNPSAIILKTGITVPGDVVCGPGGDIDAVINEKASTVILGETYPAAEPLEFPPVSPPPPALVPPMGSIKTTTTIKTSGTYTSINIPNNGTVDVDPDGGGNVTIYVTGNLTLNNAASFVVNAGASLTLYLGGNIEDKNSAGIGNLNGDQASTLKIYGLPTCTSMVIKAKGDLAAAIYAPNADVDIYNGANSYGSVVANSFEMKNSGNFTFDTRLTAGGINDPQTVFDLGRWWEE